MEPLLKLCGNHSAQDTKVSIESRAHYIGFVFAKSKRRVERNQVHEWLISHPNYKQKLVALFVNASTEDIKDSIVGLPIDIIQCHGNETVEEVADIKKRTDLPVWKAIHHSEHAIKVMKSYAGVVSGYIVDCKVGDKWGGTGVSFDWNYIPYYLEEGKKQGVPVFIAGGIRPENVQEVLAFQPDGIDVSSGIEEDGRKSKKLIRQLEERMYQNDNISR